MVKFDKVFRADSTELLEGTELLIRELGQHEKTINIKSFDSFPELDCLIYSEGRTL
jgi:hypothetical protein